ncbi:hypothetical protein PAAG_12441 [Paracoccidioides lutzii Pb01]|uniref:Uncharacterized protein n=1 Tax=Paracoccidioides lutzii (strain ATCC MYA-826 / Pb01) TaxID=502779 RepID=A0A0A2V056_PARBA|nr:hypothetical protein PAAG_12441 [Paracoccidioides lutzii Pb01]KGQ00898.1 hypothetical protein PAAG_12441 [Paracoccidioides lutzii Pb01]
MFPSYASLSNEPIRDVDLTSSLYTNMDTHIPSHEGCLLALAATVAVLAAYFNVENARITQYIIASVLFAVGTSITQLKWLWLKGTRRLQDLQLLMMLVEALWVSSFGLLPSWRVSLYVSDALD